MDIGFVAAVLGGLLALLSPCSALLLPSFFAYAFRDRGGSCCAPASSTRACA